MGMPRLLMESKLVLADPDWESVLRANSIFGIIMGL